MGLHRPRSSLTLVLLVAALGATLNALSSPPPLRAQPRSRVAHVAPPARTAVRPRFGVAFDVGPFARSDALGVGATAAFGKQYGDFFALYYEPRLFFGGFVAADRESAVFCWYNALMFDLTLFDALQLGIGPSLDVAAVDLCDGNGCDRIGGLFPGADFRVAVVLGGHDLRSPVGRRHGVSVALHSHPTWIGRNRAITSVTLGLGLELY